MLKLKLKMRQKTERRVTVSSLAFLLMLVLSSFSMTDLQAQSKVSGTVKDATGMPLPGVNVLQRGTNNGTVTDFDGKFSINLSSKSKTIVISYLGYKTKEVAVGNQSTVNITLEDDTQGLDEVVVIGYASISRDKILGATSNLKSESIAQAAPTDALQGVQGKLAGVQILSNNGPGEGFDIRIRGIGSLNGATGPLFVVDGQQTFNIDNINPGDIESFEVLKDGATTAAYGAQGANGVVLVTTKSGKKGELNVSINTFSGVNNLVGAVPVSTARHRIEMERILDGAGTSLTRLDSLSLGYRNSPDNQGIITRQAFRHQTNLTLSGGSENSKFYWNTGYLNEEGVVLNSDFSRFSTRLKLDLTPTAKFSAGIVANMTYERTNGISSGAVLGNSLNRIPYIAIFAPNGDLSPTPTSFNGSGNPVQQLLLRESLRNNYRFNIFNYAQYKILPQLSIKSTLGVTMGYDKREGFTPSSLNVGGSGPNSFASANETHELSYNIQQDNFLNYSQGWGSHSLSAFAGMQIQSSRKETLGLSTRLSNDLIQTLNNSDVEYLVSTNATGNVDQAQFSLFAGFNYDFDSKYLFNATIRRDGSSRFGPQNQYGVFPSASIGWRASKEGFLKDVKSIDNLMIRASYGIVGNDRIGTFEYLSSLEPRGYYDGVLGFVPVTFGNEIIKWEQTESSNIGFDLAMYKRRLNIGVDVWLKDTKDLLVNTQLPEESGFSVARENKGVIRNKGIDFNINGTIIKNKTFTWEAGFNIGLLDNEVVQLDTPIISGVALIEEGQPIGNFTGFKQNGIFQYDQSNAYTPTGERLMPVFDGDGAFTGYNSNGGQPYTGDVRQLIYKATGKPLLGGDYIWDDKNNDGFIDEQDTQILGNGIATVYGGLSQDFKYKGFTLGVLFDYTFGNEIYRRYDHDRNSFRAGTITPNPERIDGAWREQGDIAIYPAIANAATRPQNRFDFAGNTANSLYIEDGSFIKWRYIRLGYAVPKKVLNSFNIGLKALVVNLQANNLLTWTNYSGYSPEFGNRDSVLQPSVDNLRYPSTREILLSLRVQF